MFSSKEVASLCDDGAATETLLSHSVRSVALVSYSHMGAAGAKLLAEELRQSI
jgi:hypothetical protein